MLALTTPTAAEADQRFMWCDAPSAVAEIHPATGSAHYQHGFVRLRSGAVFEISTPYGSGPGGTDDHFLIRLRKADHLQLCYAPPQAVWASEISSTRMAFVGDVESGDYETVIAHPPGTLPK